MIDKRKRKRDAEKVGPAIREPHRINASFELIRDGAFEEKAEVESSGVVTTRTTFVNDPAYFPELNFMALQSEMRDFAASDLRIQRIILYRQVRHQHPHYCVGGHLPAHDLWKQWLGKDNTGPMFGYYLLSLDVDQEDVESMMVDWPPDCLRWRIDEKFMNVFKEGKEENFRRLVEDWEVFVRGIDEEIIDVYEDRAWLLFERREAVIRVHAASKDPEIVFCFYRENSDFWRIGKPGQETSLKNRIGLERIYRLLCDPGKEIHYSDLKCGRTAARDTVKGAISRIGTSDSIFGEYLEKSISTGKHLTFKPDPFVQLILTPPDQNES